MEATASVSTERECAACHLLLPAFEFAGDSETCQGCLEIAAAGPTKRLPDLPPFLGYKIGRHERVSLEGFCGLERREGFDCLTLDLKRIVLSADEITAAEEAGIKFISKTPRTGLEMVFTTGARLAIDVADLPEMEAAFKEHQTTTEWATYLTQKRER